MVVLGCQVVRSPTNAHALQVTHAFTSGARIERRPWATAGGGGGEGTPIRLPALLVYISDYLALHTASVRAPLLSGRRESRHYLIVLTDVGTTWSYLIGLEGEGVTLN